MRKLTIKNRARAKWEPVIEAKIRIMLGSILANIKKVEVEFEITNGGEHDSYSAYTCRLILVDSSGKLHVLRNKQPDGHMAIEGAIARARRALTRLSRHGNSGWSRASAG